MFFICQAVVRDRTERRLDPTSRQAAPQLGQGQVRRLRDVVEQKRSVLLEIGGATIPAHRRRRQRAVHAQSGTPAARAGRADAEPLRNLRARQALLQCSDDPTTKIDGQGGRHGSSSRAKGVNINLTTPM